MRKSISIYFHAKNSQNPQPNLSAIVASRFNIAQNLQIQVAAAWTQIRAVKKQLR
jgi:hypothetical protein